MGKLLEPFRTEDRDEAARCLTAQGGLDACRLSFFTDDDTGGDGVWDNWRVEGPSFVWHYRGEPARPRLGERGRRRGREAERVGTVRTPRPEGAAVSPAAEALFNAAQTLSEAERRELAEVLLDADLPEPTCPPHARRGVPEARFNAGPARPTRRRGFGRTM